jgi:hypothetical protein
VYTRRAASEEQAAPSNVPQKRKDPGRFAVPGAALDKAIEATGTRQAIEELRKGKEGLQRINVARARNTVSQRAGFQFENAHAATFNAEAAKARSPLRAVTGNQGGFSIDPRSDIKVMAGSRVVADAQLKCEQSAVHSGLAVGNPKYDGAQLVVPADQKEGARRVLKKSAARRSTSDNPVKQQKGKYHAKAAKGVDDRIRVDGVDSAPVTRQEALDMAKGDTGFLDRKIRSERVAQYRDAALFGAAFSGAVGGVSAAYRYAKGEITGAEALRETAKETAVGAGKAVATAALTEVAQKVLKKSGPAGVVAGLVMETTIDACNGTLTPAKAVRNVTTAGASWGGAELGVVAGSCLGPIGMIAGGVIGGIFGGWLAGSVCDAF